MRIARFIVAKELFGNINIMEVMPGNTGIVRERIMLDTNQIEFTVTHPDLSDVTLAEGCEYPLITPIVTKKMNGALVWDWNQNAKQYDVCTECDVKHYMNCRTCFGFGVSRNTNTPISAGTANHMLAEDWMPCPECGSTVTGMPNP